MSRGSLGNAFSLVELSIVLVILGLLTGGILAGQSLIRAAELRSFTSDQQRIIAAVHTFRDKYMALPGDMPNAVMFWNRQENQTWCKPTTGAAIATPGTCNGDGDGMIEVGTAGSQSGERFQLWRQLAFAGLLEGSYSGLAGPAAVNDHLPGTNCPSPRIKNTTCWSFFWRGQVSGDTFEFDGDYGNHMSIAGIGNTLFSPEEMWNIDTKLDDGMPATGRVLADIGCTNATASNDFSIPYPLSSGNRRCRPNFLRAI